MIGYTKLFQNIVTSSIWNEDDKTRVVWITLLALANGDGIVESSLSSLAVMARVDKESCATAVEKLSSPDRESRTPEHEGRRIEKVDGGWVVLNHGKYKAKMSLESRRAYVANKQKEYRAKKKLLDNGHSVQQVIKERVDAQEFVEKHD